MADVELVIKIPDHLYKLLKEFPSDSNESNIENVLMKAVEHGTPLPKGHGRLIDADDFKKTVCTYQQTGCGDCKHSLCCPEDAPTVIPAERSDAE